MAAIKRRRDTRIALGFACAVFLVAFVWLYDAPMFLPHQGVQSILAADSLLAGRGFEVAPDTPFAKFGPFYPLLLALLGRAGVEVTPAVYLINCAALAVTLFGIFVLGRWLEVRAIWAVLALFCIWAPNYYLIRAARPDPIAIAASILALVGMISYSRRPSVHGLLLTALACAVAASTRYMAVLTLLPLFFLTVCLLRDVSWRRRGADLGIFGVIAAAPVAVWMVRNLQVTGFLTGMSRSTPRTQWAEHYGFGGNLYGFMKTIVVDAFGIGALGIRRVVYGEEPLPHPVLIGVMAVVIFAVLLFVAWRSRADLARYVAENVRDRTVCGIALVLVGTYVTLYTVVLLVVWTLSNNDPIETRYVAPLYGFLFLAVALLFSVSWQSLTRGWALAALLAVVLFTGAPNAMKSVRLLGVSAPGPTLMPVGTIGPRGNNWIAPVSWDDLGK